MEEELKPCPFCGSIPTLRDLAGWEIHCKCGVEMVLAEPDKGPLIAAWNHRSAIAAPAQEPKYADLCNGDAAIFPKVMQLKPEWNAIPAQEPEGYSDEWILEQFRRTLILLDEKEPLVKALRIFGNRVLMQFGDSEGMHRAFSEAYERDKAERSAAPAPTAAPVVPEGFVLVPIEPTEDMESAFDDAHHRAYFKADAYRAMLAVAPKPDA